MDVIETIRYLNSLEGPHISLTRISIYCGCDRTTLAAYLRGAFKPTPEMRQQLEKGVSELIQEIYDEGKWLYNRNV